VITIGWGAQKCLTDKAGMLGVVADHAAPKDETMAQRWVAEDTASSPARETLSRQSEGVAHCRTQQHPE
jgi:hypothetical protein